MYRSRIVAFSVSIVTLGAAGALALAGAASAAGTVVTVPLPNAALDPKSIVVDSAHGHIFIPSNEGLLVTSLSGVVQTSLPVGPVPIQGLALSPDGATLYAGIEGAQPGIEAISAGDLSKITETSTDGYEVLSAPVVTGGRVWFGARNTTTQAYAIGSIDPAGSAAPVYTPIAYQPWDLTVGAGAADTLIVGGLAPAATVGGSPTDTLEVYHAVPGGLTEKAQSPDYEAEEPMAVSADGRYLITTDFGTLRLSNLTQVPGVYEPGSADTDQFERIDVSVAPDGAVAFAVWTNGGTGQLLEVFAPNAALPEWTAVSSAPGFGTDDIGEIMAVRWEDGTSRLAYVSVASSATTASGTILALDSITDPLAGAGSSPSQTASISASPSKRKTPSPTPTRTPTQPATSSPAMRTSPATSASTSRPATVPVEAVASATAVADTAGATESDAPTTVAATPTAAVSASASASATTALTGSPTAAPAVAAGGTGRSDAPLILGIAGAAVLVLGGGGGLLYVRSRRRSGNHAA